MKVHVALKMVRLLWNLVPPYAHNILIPQTILFPYFFVFLLYFCTHNFAYIFRTQFIYMYMWQNWGKVQVIFIIYSSKSADDKSVSNGSKMCGTFWDSTIYFNEWITKIDNSMWTHLNEFYSISYWIWTVFRTHVIINEIREWLFVIYEQQKNQFEVNYLVYSDFNSLYRDVCNILKTLRSNTIQIILF